MGLDVGVGLEEVDFVVEIRKGPVTVGSVAGVVTRAADQGDRVLLRISVPACVLLCDFLRVQVVLRDQAAGAPANDAGAELANVPPNGGSWRGSWRDSRWDSCRDSRRVARTYRGCNGRTIDHCVPSSGRQIENCIVLEFGTGIVAFTVVPVGREICQVDYFRYVFPIAAVLIVAEARQINDLYCVYGLKPLNNRLGCWRQRS